MNSPSSASHSDSNSNSFVVLVYQRRILLLSIVASIVLLLIAVYNLLHFSVVDDSPPRIQPFSVLLSYLFFTFMTWIGYEYMKRSAIVEMTWDVYRRQMIFVVIGGLAIISVASSPLLDFSAPITNEYSGFQSAVHLVQALIVGAVLSAMIIALFLFYATIVVQHPHRKTKRLAQWQIISLIATLFFSGLRRTFGIEDITPFTVLAMLTFYVVSYLNVKNLRSATFFSRKEKIRSIWLSLGCGLVLVFLFGWMYSGDEYRTIDFFLFPPLRVLFPAGVGLASIVAFRIFTTGLFSLSTTDLVDKKNVELSSLAEFNRELRAQLKVEQIIESFSKRAFTSTRATMGWVVSHEGARPEYFNAPRGVTVEYAEYIERVLQLPVRLAGLTSTTCFRNLKALDLSEELAVDLSRYAQSFIFSPISDGSATLRYLVLVNRDEFGFELDDQRVVQTLCDSCSTALSNALLIQDSIEKEWFKKELDIAKAMQRKLIPQSAPSHPFFDIAFETLSAQEVGGDFIDLVFLKDNRLCVFVGDVSGKGMSAAFYMAQLKGVVLSHAQEATGPADMLRRVNRTLTGVMDRSSYITLTCLVLETESSTVSFARAGHTPIIVSGTTTTSHIPRGLGIGLVPAKFFDETIEECSVKLNEGDSLLLFSDGLNETRDKSGTELGIQRVELFMSESGSMSSAGELLHGILESALSFSEGTPQHDDLTALVLFCKKVKHDSEPIVDGNPEGILIGQ